jgi:predicted RNA-binding Zn-ribbon protein involved in translation (DUF1610 family)
LNVESWEMELDYETDLIIAERSKVSSNICPKCGENIKGSVCEKCGAKGLKEKYYDPDFDEYADMVEKDNEDFEKNLKWEEVPENS